jgi:Ca2+-binding RTX toxin-like protein
MGKILIDGGGGANVIFGDNGRVTTSANGSVMIESWRLDDGDDDLILIDGTDSGNDTILGGKGSDRIESVSNNPGDDIILGDHGRIERFNGQVTQITTENYDGYGADDFIVAA